MAENTLGIDFGTSYCTMCRCNPETGKPEVIRDECGLDKIPSVVYWGPDGDVRVGDAAVAVLQESSAMPPEKGREARARVIASVKRRFFPDRIIALPGGETVYPVDAAAAILKYLKRNAEERCFHGPARSATLTHPASFTRAQKTLLEEAGKKAGFEAVRLLEEPVAAAMGYAASGAQVGKGVLVYDFGGGTLDLAFVARDGDGGFRVPVAPCGDASCGGDDFDRALYDYAEADLLNTQGVRFSEEGVDLSFLLACRQVKERLSHAESGVVRHFLEGKNTAYTLSVDRKTFEGLIASNVAHTAELAEELLRRVKEAKFEVDTVVLIGGSSRLPLVREALGKAIKPLAPLATMHDDCAVAMGAAYCMQMGDERLVTQQTGSKAAKVEKDKLPLGSWPAVQGVGSRGVGVDDRAQNSSRIHRLKTNDSQLFRTTRIEFFYSGWGWAIFDRRMEIILDGSSLGMGSLCKGFRLEKTTSIGKHCLTYKGLLEKGSVEFEIHENGHFIVDLEFKEQSVGGALSIKRISKQA